MSVEKGKDRDGSAQGETKKGGPRYQRKGGRAPNAKFVGQCEDMKEDIYDIGEESQADLYVKTTNKLVTYVGRTFGEAANDLKRAIKTLENPLDDLKEPEDPPKDASEVDIYKWKEAVKVYHKKSNYLEVGLGKLYSTIWGQCTDALLEKIRSADGASSTLPSFQDVDDAQDGIGLLKLVKNFMYQGESSKVPPFVAVDEARRASLSLRQGHMSADAYLTQFQNRLRVLDATGGAYPADPGTMEYLDPKKKMSEKARQEAAIECAKAYGFLKQSDQRKYGPLLQELKNRYVMGHDEYPRTLQEAYGILISWRRADGHDRGGGRSDAAAFTTTEDVEEGVSNATKGSGKGKAHIQCHKCKKFGHFKDECDQVSKNESGKDESSNQQDGEAAATNVTYSVAMASAGEKQPIPDTWILLDSQSTVDLFKNKELLMNIRKADGTLVVHSTAGVSTTNLVGDFPGYGEVWYYPEGVANIISWSNAEEKGFEITYENKELRLHRADGTYRAFRKSNGGLHFSDTALDAGRVDAAMVSTVAQNKSNFTNADYSRAVLARKIQIMTGRPSTKDLLYIVDNNLLRNCPITRKDVLAAEKIFGPDVGSLKGKTVRRSPDQARVEFQPLPAELMRQYSKVTLCADIMSVNKILFLVTISRNIKFGTATMIADKRQKTVFSALRDVCKVYKTRGFRVETMLMDGEFNCHRGDLADLGVTVNPASADEHVGDIERYIRTVKERVRCICNTLPFTRLPNRVVIEMVYFSVFWLNSFPATNGISDRLSPRTIVTGQTVDYNKHCRLEFGSYVQVHEEHDNSMASRTTGALALRPTGNAQGGYYFLSLTTGRVITRKSWTSLPMPQDVIDRVHVLARRQHAERGVAFADRDGIPLLFDDDDDDDDSTYVEENDLYSLHDDSIAGVSENEDDDYSIDGPAMEAHGEPEEAEDEPAEEAQDEHAEDLDDAIQPADEADAPPIDLEVEAPGEENVEEEAALDMDQRWGARTGTQRYHLRDRREPSFDYRYGHSNLSAELEEVILSQYSMKKGIKLFGEKGVEAVRVELEQLHERQVMKPVDAKTLTHAEKRGALDYLMFLKEKRTGKIKGRGCADGRKQRLYTAKEDASSPTVAIESLMLTCVIDAKEKRDVATADIPGAFMQADMDEVVYMRLEGKMVEILLEIAPEVYGPYVTEVNGKKVLYVLLVKALYGTLRAALLFWRKLTGKLTSWGFELNPYDQCVANKMVNGKQCTIVWHVDDLKISHEDPEVVSNVLDDLNAEFGKEAPLTVTRGKIHDYLGMRIDYSTPGKVAITMVDYIDNMLRELPEDMAGTATSPASNHLFNVNNDNPAKLDKETSEMFHHNVAKLLFLCKRARPDVQTVVAFLTKRVKAPDMDDYKKLRRVMQYLRGTLDMPLTLEADDTHVVKWWIDASFAVHPDMKSHTGGMMSLGKGAVYGTSTGQKLVTRSSTEAEIAGVYDVLPQVMWTRNFLDAQGYGVVDSVVHQDNRSAMLLEINGRASSSKRTRHLNLRYFFVTDLIKAKEVSVVHCPTEEMISDFFTKPLQGALFRKFRNLIMNVDPDAAGRWDHRSVLEIVP